MPTGIRVADDIAHGREGRVGDDRLNPWLLRGDEQGDSSTHRVADHPQVRVRNTPQYICYGRAQITGLIKGEREWAMVALTTTTKIEEQDIVAGTPEIGANTEEFVLCTTVTGASDNHTP